MNERSQKLLEIRPVLPNAKIVPGIGTDERFQNSTLRPILKFQNDLLLASFQNYIKKTKNTFYELNIEKRMGFITNALQKDIKYRNSIKGMVIGQFTVAEYEEYILNSSAYNKRMINMVIKRLQDQIQYFEVSALIQ
ncbi:MAG: glyoxalase [Maribacter sp.]